ncbi:capsid cement protein [Gordonia sp. CPCC 206044]|uniref:capsid cement protein n=1 Tax=Gordonia sp. CPCC 206044 TaxID=3140793 RepID=UPI003AF365A0
MSTTITNPRTYKPGSDVTCQATAAVTSRHLVAISGDRAARGNIAVAPATAGGRIFGVAVTDADTDHLVTVARDGIVLVTAGATVNAGDDVEVGANATVIPNTDGVVIGQAVATATAGSDAEIALR